MCNCFVSTRLLEQRKEHCRNDFMHWWWKSSHIAWISFHDMITWPSFHLVCKAIFPLKLKLAIEICQCCVSEAQHHSQFYGLYGCSVFDSASSYTVHIDIPLRTCMSGLEFTAVWYLLDKLPDTVPAQNGCIFQQEADLQYLVQHVCLVQNTE